MSGAVGAVSLVRVQVAVAEAAVAKLLRLQHGQMDLRLVVAPLSEALDYADDYMLRQGLKDDSPLAGFEGITVGISLYAPHGSIGEAVGPVLVDHLGCALSRDLATTAIVDLSDGDLLFRVYESGRCVRDHSDSCREYLQRVTGWVPLPTSASNPPP